MAPTHRHRQGSITHRHHCHPSRSKRILCPTWPRHRATSCAATPLRTFAYQGGKETSHPRGTTPALHTHQANRRRPGHHHPGLLHTQVTNNCVTSSRSTSSHARPTSAQDSRRHLHLTTTPVYHRSIAALALTPIQTMPAGSFQAHGFRSRASRLLLGGAAWLAMSTPCSTLPTQLSGKARTKLLTSGRGNDCYDWKAASRVDLR